MVSQSAHLEVVQLAKAIEDLRHRRRMRELDRRRSEGLDDETLRQVHEASRGRDVRRRPRIT